MAIEVLDAYDVYRIVRLTQQGWTTSNANNVGEWWPPKSSRVRYTHYSLHAAFNFLEGEASDG